MKPGESIVIERTANGWIVRQHVAPNDLMCIHDTLVFNLMGYASGEGGSKETLLTFVERHFSRPSSGEGGGL